jgi:hypothetical protein
MEEAPENGKKSLYSAHANGMNEWMNIFNVTTHRIKVNVLFKGQWGLTQEYSRWGTRLNTQLHAVQKLRMSEAILLLPLYAFIVGIWTTLPFYKINVNSENWSVNSHTPTHALLWHDRYTCFSISSVTGSEISVNCCLKSSTMFLT